jgi:hypothetical protein
MWAKRQIGLSAVQHGVIAIYGLRSPADLVRCTLGSARTAGLKQMHQFCAQELMSLIEGIRRRTRRMGKAGQSHQKVQ